MYRLIAYSLPNGYRLERIPFTSCSWREEWNEAGSMSVTIIPDEDSKYLDLNSLLLEQRTMLALFDGSRLVHAGPILESPTWDGAQISVSVGGGWSLFDSRLVLDARMRGEMIQDQVRIDEDNPDPKWFFTYAGLPGEIIRGLIEETDQWGSIPVRGMKYEGVESDKVAMTWNGWEFTTVGDAFRDVLDLDNGGQLRFDPLLNAAGSLGFEARWAKNGVSDRSEPFRWNARSLESRVVFTGVGSSGVMLANDVWTNGGKANDNTVIVRVSGDRAQNEPLLQAGDSSHNTDGSIDRLRRYATGLLNASRAGRTWNFKVGVELAPKVGDRVVFTVKDPFLYELRGDGSHASASVALIVTDVEGTVGSEWLTVGCRASGDTVNGVTSTVNDPTALMARQIRRIERLAKKALAPSGTQIYQSVKKLQNMTETLREG